MVIVVCFFTLKYSKIVGQTPMNQYVYVAPIVPSG